MENSTFPTFTGLERYFVIDHRKKEGQRIGKQESTSENLLKIGGGNLWPAGTISALLASRLFAGFGCIKVAALWLALSDGRQSRAAQ